jgi:hypothetical protein
MSVRACRVSTLTEMSAASNHDRPGQSDTAGVFRAGRWREDQVRDLRMTSTVRVAARLILPLFVAAAALGACSSGTSSSGSPTATAPPGSSQSFSDGYLAALIGCGFQPNGQPVTDISTQGCQMIPDMRYSNSDQINVWCQNAVAIAMDTIPSSDDSSQWYAGCEAVVAKATF